MRQVRVVRGLLVSAGLMVLRRFLVVPRGVLVVFSGLLVMLGGLPWTCAPPDGWEYRGSLGQLSRTAIWGPDEHIVDRSL